MEKIAKQVIVNIFLILLSVGVIVFAKTLAIKEFSINNWECYMGPDILFVIISSLLTTIGWRFSEKIELHWLYNLTLAFVMICFIVEYGTAVAFGNDFENPFFSKLILLSLILFLVICFIEYLGIIIYFKRSMSGNSVSSGLVVDFRYREVGRTL